MKVLPEIVKAVEGKVPVFVDCSIDSGYDVFKALALGATGTWVGRANTALEAACNVLKNGRQFMSAIFCAERENSRTL